MWTSASSPTATGCCSAFPDFYAQALAKIESGHAQDGVDVTAMLDRGLVEPSLLREHFEAVAPRLYRYPAVDPKSFRAALDAALAGRA